jgi:hypothetical protein
LNSVTGSGVVTGVAFGWRIPSASGSGSGTLPDLAGDTTGPPTSNTTSKINNTAFAGTNGHIVSFGASNTPSDSGITASNSGLRTPGAYFAIASATTVCANVAYSGTIIGAYIWADSAVSATVDVKTVAFGSFTGPGSTSSITGGSPATISAGTNATPSVAGWSTSVTANTMVCFVPSGITAGAASYFIAALKIAVN